MQAFGVGDAGNHNLPFRVMTQGRSLSHQNPYCCCYICSKPEPPEPELQRVVHALDQKGCWKRRTPPFQIAMPEPCPRSLCLGCPDTGFRPRPFRHTSHEPRCRSVPRDIRSVSMRLKNGASKKTTNISINPRPFFVFRHLHQCRGGATPWRFETKRRRA